MQAMVYGYERKEFYRLKRCLRVSKTQDQHQLFIISLYLVVFVEKTTYNLINLKYQNSLNIGHNANPTFYLMDNQSQSSDNIRGFIMDAKSHVCSSIFFLDMAFTQHFSQFSNMPPVQVFFLLALSQTLDFCSKPSLSLLSSLICPQYGV